jgi:hypothetical protein
MGGSHITPPSEIVGYRGNRVVTSIPNLVTCGRFLWKAPTNPLELISDDASVAGDAMTLRSLSAVLNTRSSLPRLLQTSSEECDEWLESALALYKKSIIASW